MCLTPEPGTPLAERETRIQEKILRGTVPEFLRRLSPVTLRDGTNVAVIHATLAGTPLESRGYACFGPHTYEPCIDE